jgi:predicted membrane protein
MAKDTNKAGEVSESKNALKKEIEDREKLKKIRDKQHLNRLKAEKKRVKKIISYPSKTIFRATLIVFFVAFLFYYIGEQASLVFSVYSSFIVYSAITAIATIIMFTGVVMAAEHKKNQVIKLKQAQLEKKQEEDLKKSTERQRIDDELRSAEIRRRQDRSGIDNRSDDFFNLNNNLNNDFNSINVPNNFGSTSNFESSPLQAR